MKVKLVLLSMMLFSLLVATQAQIAPKREFRGVWMHTVFSDDYAQKSNEQIKNFLLQRLNEYQSVGMNVLIFQVRPEPSAVCLIVSPMK